ncbi:MAG: BlaI/MecI/CopY family transcriptional regulator [Planctomycetota bacterium]|jgi:predicted transcriptional regulator
MARPTSRHPTELELEILKVLWRRGPLPVRTVRDELAGFRDLATTSVITVMNIMVEKGYLARRKAGRSFIYEPRVAEGTVTGGMLRDLIARAFGGSTEVMMLNLLASDELDRTEIGRLRRLLGRTTKGKR